MKTIGNPRYAPNLVTRPPIWDVLREPALLEGWIHHDSPQNIHPQASSQEVVGAHQPQIIGSAKQKSPRPGPPWATLGPPGPTPQATLGRLLTDVFGPFLGIWPGILSLARAFGEVWCLCFKGIQKPVRPPLGKQGSCLNRHRQKLTPKTRGGELYHYTSARKWKTPGVVKESRLPRGHTTHFHVMCLSECSFFHLSPAIHMRTQPTATCFEPPRHSRRGPSLRQRSHSRSPAFVGNEALPAHPEPTNEFPLLSMAGTA